MEAKEFGAKGLAISVTLILTGVAVAFLAIGCGEQKSKTTVQRAEAEGITSGIMETGAKTTPAVQASTETTSAEATTATEDTATPSADPAAGTIPVDALPPDVAASVTETIAAPGGVVEILAEGSPDVTAVTLTDAVGKKYPFEYQAATDRWRVLYRIPIRAHGEQLGLSVTAANGSNRWKRIWVFVDIGQAKTTEEADSTR